jgi:hypothetical protein
MVDQLESSLYSDVDEISGEAMDHQYWISKAWLKGALRRYVPSKMSCQLFYHSRLETPKTEDASIGPTRPVSG